MMSGYTGISFPFRIGVNGGVQMSTTGVTNAQHILESIQQILSTEYSERPMEIHIYSDVDNSLFTPDQDLAREILSDTIVEAIERLEERVSIQADDIDYYTVETEEGYIELYCNMLVYIEDYETYYQMNGVRLGVM